MKKCEKCGLEVRRLREIPHEESTHQNPKPGHMICWACFLDWEDPCVTSPAPPEPAVMVLECMECGRKFRTRSLDPECPRCGSVDLEVAP